MQLKTKQSCKIGTNLYSLRIQMAQPRKFSWHVCVLQLKKKCRSVNISLVKPIIHHLTKGFILINLTMIKCAKPFLLIMVLNAVAIAVTLQTFILRQNLEIVVVVGQRSESFRMIRRFTTMFESLLLRACNHGF